MTTSQFGSEREAKCIPRYATNFSLPPALSHSCLVKNSFFPQTHDVFQICLYMIKCHLKSFSFFFASFPLLLRCENVCHSRVCCLAKCWIFRCREKGKYFVETRKYLDLNIFIVGNKKKLEINSLMKIRELKTITKCTLY